MMSTNVLVRGGISKSGMPGHLQVKHITTGSKKAFYLEKRPTIVHCIMLVSLQNWSSKYTQLAYAILLIKLYSGQALSKPVYVSECCDDNSHPHSAQTTQRNSDEELFYSFNKKHSVTTSKLLWSSLIKAVKFTLSMWMHVRKQCPSFILASCCFIGGTRMLFSCIWKWINRFLPMSMYMLYASS